MTKLYLSELIDQYKIMDYFEEGEVNLIHANAGSGKTTWILQMIDEARCGGIFSGTDTQFYYVCDTRLLKQQFKGEYATQRAEVDGIAVEQLYKVGEFGEYIPESCHIMTYTGWLFLMRNCKRDFSNVTFFFDEPQSLAQNCFNEHGNYDDWDEEEVCDYIQLLLEQSRIFALSATPDKFISMLYQNGIDVNDLLEGHKDKLRQYTSDKVIKYHETLSQLLSHITFNRCAIYWTGSIEDLKEEVKLIRELGFNVNYVVSDDRCGIEQQLLKERIIKNNDVPEEYDIIIYNKSMGTGINILDRENSFDTFITYATNAKFIDADDEHQARMRIRHNLKVEYKYVKAHDIRKADKDDMKLYEETNRRIDLLDSVIDQKLTTAEFKELAKELNFTNPKNGRLIANPKDEIAELGFKVNDKKSNGTRFKVITK